eukprot:3324211-Amphidinium_carterae.3
MDASVRKVLNGKSVLLLKELLWWTGHPDSSLCDELAAEFSVPADAAYSEGPLAYGKGQVQATRSTPKHQWATDIIAEEVWAKSQMEAECGWLTGPVPVGELQQLGRCGRPAGGLALSSPAKYVTWMT